MATSEMSDSSETEMMLCPVCMHPNQETAAVCEHCGGPLSGTVMFDPVGYISGYRAVAWQLGHGRFGSLGRDVLIISLILLLLAAAAYALFIFSIGRPWLS